MSQGEVWLAAGRGFDKSDGGRNRREFATDLHIRGLHQTYRPFLLLGENKQEIPLTAKQFNMFLDNNFDTFVRIKVSLTTCLLYRHMSNSNNLITSCFYELA